MGTPKQLPCRLQLKALRVKRTADTVTTLSAGCQLACAAKARTPS